MASNYTATDMENLLNKLKNDKKNPYSLDYWDEKKKILLNGQYF